MESDNELDFFYIFDSFDQDIEKEKADIEEQIKKENGIIIVVYGFSHENEEIIKHSLRSILKKYNKESIIDAIYNVLYESIFNGLKANAKKLFFAENSLDIDNPEDYANGISLFKKSLSKINLTNSGIRNKSKDIFVRIKFTYDETGLEIDVLNNTKLLPMEEERIRKKLAKGDKYDDLMSFYMDNSDSTEGEGLGLVLSLILLKAENLDPSLFRIGTKNGSTFARIEIPFNSNFVSKRKKILN